MRARSAFLNSVSVVASRVPKPARAEDAIELLSRFRAILLDSLAIQASAALRAAEALERARLQLSGTGESA